MVRRIEKVAVIGSGIMGGGIAALCASAGVPTLLLDIVPFDLKDEEKNDPAARNRIVKAGLEGAIKAKPPLFMHKTDVELIETGNLEDDFDKLKDCDLIVEVIVENLKIKQDLFARVDKIRKPTAIIASNTSGLPLAKMAEGRSQSFKEHFIITHFFNPVRWMHLLELVSGKDTSKEVVDFIAEWGEKILGKGIVWAKDTPNFIGNRIGVAMIGQALKLIEKSSVAIPEVDALFGPSFGMPKTGIFALSDLVGLDTIGHLADNSYELLANDEYREVYKLPEFFKKMVANKMLGNKTRETGGFYKSEKTPDGKKVKKVLDLATFEFKEFDKKNVTPDVVKKAKMGKNLADKQKRVLYAEGPHAEFAWNLTSFLLVYAANRIPEIADTVVDIDNAMKWGYAWEAGPFEVWDNIGIKESIPKIEAAGHKVPDKIKKMVEAGNETFYKVEAGKEFYFDFASNSYKEKQVAESAIVLKNLKASKKEVKGNDFCSLIDLGDGVYCLEFHSMMNAINKAMIEFMAEAGQFVRENGTGLVIGNQATGMPAAFSAGGDLFYMLSLASSKKFSEIDNFIKLAQENIINTKYAPFPVVAAPHGLALGGGCETCMAADMIVAHTDLFMGLVEIGAGLLPAGGGCTNAWKNAVTALPRGVTIQDMGQLFISVFQNIAMGKVSMSAEEARDMGFLKKSDRIIFNKDYQIGEAKKEVLRMVEDGYTPPKKLKYPVMGEPARGMINANLLSMRLGGYVTEYEEWLAKRIAFVLAGGDVPQGTLITEEYMLKLEREAFVDFWKEEKTQKKAQFIMTSGGKPLRI